MAPPIWHTLNQLQPLVFALFAHIPTLEVTENSLIGAIDYQCPGPQEHQEHGLLCGSCVLGTSLHQEGEGVGE